MKLIIISTGICLVMALGVVIPTTAQRTNEHKPSSGHAAAVRRCRDQLTADKRAAKDLSGAPQKAALAAAERDYADCLKEASKIP